MTVALAMEEMMQVVWMNAAHVCFSFAWHVSNLVMAIPWHVLNLASWIAGGLDSVHCCICFSFMWHVSNLLTSLDHNP